MPLTINLFGLSPENHGHIIIDRNNLIFAYPIVNVDLAVKNITDIESILRADFCTKILSLISTERNFLETEDLRHNALEHLCDYDRYKCVHTHAIFKDDVSLHIMEIFFNSLSQCPETFISKNCIKMNLEIVSQYFYELENSERAQKIETEYRKDKHNEYKQAEEIETAKPKPQIEIVNSLDHIGLMMMGFLLERISEVRYIVSNNPLTLFASNLKESLKQQITSTFYPPTPR